jgi:sugar O-acyltransferase (sialic acid O-acetyltransferase NeuD family)
MKKIVILGAGGHAHVIADIIKAEGNEVVAFLDDDLNQTDCAGPISDYTKYPDCEFVIGIGNADIREKLSQLNLKWHIAIHPSAVISESANIGEGTVVMPNAVVNARTIIGKHCIINTGAIIEHDNTIGDYSHISVGSNLGGTVIIGKKCWIGIGATIKNNVNVCDDVFIGAAALVIKDINKSGTYFGIPSTFIK